MTLCITGVEGGTADKLLKSLREHECPSTSGGCKPPCRWDANAFLCALCDCSKIKF